MLSKSASGPARARSLPASEGMGGRVLLHPAPSPRTRVGGIFMDDHATGDWEADFALTQDIGRAFLPAYLPLVQERITQGLVGRRQRRATGASRALCGI